MGMICDALQVSLRDGWGFTDDRPAHLYNTMPLLDLDKDGVHYACTLHYLVFHRIQI